MVLRTRRYSQPLCNLPVWQTMPTQAEQVRYKSCREEGT